MRYESTTGLATDQIQELAARIHQVLSSRDPGRDRGQVRGRPAVLGLYRRVELTLVLVRQNLSQTLVADLFGVSQSTVSRIYRQLLPLIEQVTCLHRPSLPEALRDRVVLVDGTLVPTGNRRRDKAVDEANYSGKHHKAGVSVLVLCGLSACLLHVTDPVPGRTHDRAAFTLTGLDHLLAEVPTLGDLGFQGTPVIRPRRKRPGHPDHDPATLIWNHSIATIRIAVERAIAHLKNWKILATGYRGRLSELPNIIRIITTLEFYRLGW